MSRRVVVAIGGNSLITDPERKSVYDQYEAAGKTTAHLAPLIDEGWEVVVVHGNGPQVGFILRRSELAAHELHEIPLAYGVADTQGSIGFVLQQNLQNDLRRLGLRRRVITIVTQVEVAVDDPAFGNPTKPIGSFMDEAKAREREAEGWHVMEDAGRGWRRVVPSPAPLRIVEEETIVALLESGAVVIGAGGGGIPVIAHANGDLQAVDAVIDKDAVGALLAADVKADLFLISTGVERVALDWGTPEQTLIDEITAPELRVRLAEGRHFAAGSMKPKIEAALAYLDGGGKEVIITDTAHIPAAIDGRAGTRIVP